MRATLALAALAALVACASEQPAPEPATPIETAAAPLDTAYASEVDAWHAERVTRLQDPEGWLTLVALAWLKPGTNTIGSDPRSDVVLPDWSAPPALGTLHRGRGGVRFEAAPGVAVAIDGTDAAEATLASDASGAPTRVRHGTLSFYLIERGDRIGVRAKDSAHPARSGFTGVPRFPVDRAWRVTGHLEAAEGTLRLPTVIGTVEEVRTPGVVRFTLGDRTVALTPNQDAPGEPLFFVFGDATNGLSTYGGGRFLTTDPPREDGTVVLDFNRTTSPPCAFTPYATCPLPAEGNRLDVAIEAGERYEGPAHGLDGTPH